MKQAVPILLFLAGTLLAACRKSEPEAVIHTRFGDIRVRLYDATPLHRDNFLRLARQGHFDSLLFHRVIRDFMIQGGDPTSRNAAPGVLLGGGGLDYDLPPEIGAPHLRGALAAARLPDASNPQRHSNASQFFIVEGEPQTDETLNLWERRHGLQYSEHWRTAYKEKGGTPQLDGEYTVFGEVLEGMDVVDRIAAVPRDQNDRPLDDIRMRVTVER